MRTLSLLALLGLAACGGAPKTAAPPPENNDDATAGEPAPDALRPARDAVAADESPARPADGASPPDTAITPDSSSAPTTSDGRTQMLLSRAIGLGYYHSCLVTPTHDIKCFGNV